jgi:hypothetical protein
MRFRAPLWMHHGEGAWHFVTLPPGLADEIDILAGPDRAGFGSVRVQVTIGQTTWSTSLFPDTNAGSFVLPVKKPVRQAEALEDGDEVDVELELGDIG